MGMRERLLSSTGFPLWQGRCIPYIFCVGSFRSVRKHRFRSPGISFWKVPRVHLESTVGVNLKSRNLKKVSLGYKGRKRQPFDPSLSNVVLLYCMEASLKHKLVCLFIKYMCVMESMICRKYSSFWTQGQNPSFQSVQTIFMLILCSS